MGGAICAVGVGFLARFGGGGGNGGFGMEAAPEAGGLDVSMSFDGECSSLYSKTCVCVARRMEATPEAGGLDFDGALCAVGVGFLARFGGGGGNGGFGMEATPEAGGLDLSMSFDGALCAVGVGFFARYMHSPIASPDIPMSV